MLKYLRKLLRLLEKGFEKTTLTELYARGALTRDEYLQRIQKTEDE